MTLDVQVKDATFDALRNGFVKQGDDEVAVNRKMMEAVATIAAYNMISRFLVALDVGGQAGVPCPVPQGEVLDGGDLY